MRAKRIDKARDEQCLRSGIEFFYCATQVELT